MSKSIFITILALIAIGAQAEHSSKCFREMHNLSGKPADGLHFNFKYDLCTNKQFKFLKSHADSIANSGMEKVNPNALDGRDYAHIVKAMSKNECYVKRTDSNNYRIVFQRNADTDSYIPVVFKADKKARFAIDYAATKAATENIFYVFNTEVGPIKMDAKTDDMIEDDFCSTETAADRAADIDESVAADQEETTGVNIPADMQDPAVEEVHTQVQPTEKTVEAHASTLAELNAHFLAQEKLELQKRDAEEKIREAEEARLAEHARVEQERLDLEAANKLEQENKDFDELENTVSIHIADFDHDKNLQTKEEGEKIVHRLAEEGRKNLIAQELAEREAELKRLQDAIEAEERLIKEAQEAELRRVTINHIRAQEQRENHHNVMQDIENRKSTSHAYDYLERKQTQNDKSLAEELQSFVNRDNYTNKLSNKRLKKELKALGQQITNSENAHEKLELLFKKHAMEQQYRDIKRAPVLKIQSDHREAIDRVNNEKAARIAAHRAEEQRFKAEVARLKELKAKSMKEVHDKWLEKKRKRVINEMNAKFMAQHNAALKTKLHAELLAKHEARRQEMRESINNRRNAMTDLERNSFFVEVHSKQPTHDDEPTHIEEPSHVEPTHIEPSTEHTVEPATVDAATQPTNFGAAMDDNLEENLDSDFFALKDDEDNKPTRNGLLGGWGNWHECTQVEKDLTRNYFAMMFSQLRIHNVAVYAQNMVKCSSQVVAGKNYEVTLAFNQVECNVKFHFDLQGIIHDISGNVSGGAKSCVALYAYPFNNEATA